MNDIKEKVYGLSLFVLHLPFLLPIHIRANRLMLSVLPLPSQAETNIFVLANVQWRFYLLAVKVSNSPLCSELTAQMVFWISLKSLRDAICFVVLVVVIE